MLGLFDIALGVLILAIAYRYAWRMYRRGWDKREIAEPNAAIAKDEARARALWRFRCRLASKMVAAHCPMQKSSDVELRR